VGSSAIDNHVLGKLLWHGDFAVCPCLRSSTIEPLLGLVKPEVRCCLWCVKPWDKHCMAYMHRGQQQHMPDPSSRYCLLWAAEVQLLQQVGNGRMHARPTTPLSVGLHVLWRWFCKSW
jgi:hypothetical protein